MDEEMAALGGDDLVKEFDNSDPMKATLLLGRLVPKNVATSIGVVLVVLLLVSAGLYSTNYYFFSSPDSDDSMGGIGNYSLHLQIETRKVLMDSEFINDGDTFEIIYTLETLNFSEGFEIGSVEFDWKYYESNEMINPNGLIQEIACELDSGDNASDISTGTFSHGEWESEDTWGEGQGDGLVWGGFGEDFWEVGWFFRMWLDGNATIDFIVDGYTITNFTNISERTIHEKLTTNGAQKGDYFISVNMDAEVGGTANCPHSDDGEEVDYSLVFFAHKFWIEPRP
jgi:hypothetical protein